MGLFDKKEDVDQNKDVLIKKKEVIINKDEKKTVTPQPAVRPREATYFGKNLKITGNVSGDGDLIILGGLEGEFNVKGKLQVAEPAHISGTIKANDITVKGNVQGTITAIDKIHLDPTAKVKGHIYSPKLSVMEGAHFDGEIKMSAKSAQAPLASVSEEALKPKQTETPEKK